MVPLIDQPRRSFVLLIFVRPNLNELCVLKPHPELSENVEWATQRFIVLHHDRVLMMLIGLSLPSFSSKSPNCITTLSRDLSINLALYNKYRLRGIRLLLAFRSTGIMSGSSLSELQTIAPETLYVSH